MYLTVLEILTQICHPLWTRFRKFRFAMENVAFREIRRLVLISPRSSKGYVRRPSIVVYGRCDPHSCHGFIDVDVE